jgi:nitrate/nitrite transport system substrate-binding protein
MQAYMVAEPWNTRAISGNEGIGFTFAQGREIWNGHPDRLLAVMQSFIDENPKTYRALLKAMIEACRYCDQNREEVAQIISGRSYTGAKPKFTKPAIVGAYNYGGFDGKNRTVKSDATTLLFNLPKEVPQVANENSTFMWRSRSLWLMTQAARLGQIKEIPKDANQLAERAWRTDIYREVAAELGIACPTEDYKVEPAEAFIDKKAFDPSDPVGYLNSFDIRVSRSTNIYLS